MDWSSISVFGDAVRAVATAFPDKAALVSEGHSLTFNDSNLRMNRLANGLAARGVRPGERVLNTRTSKARQEKILDRIYGFGEGI